MKTKQLNEPYINPWKSPKTTKHEARLILLGIISYIILSIAIGLILYHNNIPTLGDLQEDSLVYRASIAMSMMFGFIAIPCLLSLSMVVFQIVKGTYSLIKTAITGE